MVVLSKLSFFVATAVARESSNFENFSRLQTAVGDAQTLETQTKERYATMTKNAITAANEAVAAMKSATTAAAKAEVDTKVAQAKDLKKRSEEMRPLVEMAEQGRKNAEEALESAEESGKKIAYLQEAAAPQEKEAQKPTVVAAKKAEEQKSTETTSEKSTTKSTSEEKSTSTPAVDTTSTTSFDHKDLWATLGDKYVAMNSLGSSERTVSSYVPEDTADHWASWIENTASFLGLMKTEKTAIVKNMYPISRKQDSAATQRAVELESEHVIDIGDGFLAQEQEDAGVLKEVKARQHRYDKKAGDQYPDDGKVYSVGYNPQSVQVHHAFAALEHVDDQIDQELAHDAGPATYHDVREIQDESMEALQYQISQQDVAGKKTKLTLLQKKTETKRV